MMQTVDYTVSVIAVFTMLSLLLRTLGLLTVCRCNVHVAPPSHEDTLLADAVRHTLQVHFTGCSLAIGTDQRLNRELQEMLIRIQRPVVISRMDSFKYDPSDYPWVWKPEHLLSFRTQPPELRSRLWPGGSCAFNLILSRNISSVPELIMHTAAHIMLRNLDDPVWIHGHDPHLLLNDPVQGIRLKLLSMFNSTARDLTIHNVCHCCLSGQNMLNPPLNFGSILDLNNLFPVPSRDMNGRRLTMGLYENLYVDMEEARVRLILGDQLSAEEEVLLFYEKTFNAVIVPTMPDLTLTEMYPNGSLSGFDRAITNNEIDIIGVMMYTDIANQAVRLSRPVYFTCPGFVTRAHRPNIKWYVMFQPFTTIMWVVIFGTILLSSVVLRMIQGADVLSHMKSLMRKLVEQPLDIPRHMAFHSVFYIFTLVVICAYKTKLVSLITFPPPENLPECVSELVDSSLTWGTVEPFLHAATVLLSNMNQPVYQLALDKAYLISSVRTCMDRTHHDFACLVSDYMYDRDKASFLDQKGNPTTLFWPERSMCIYAGHGFSRDQIHFVQFNQDLQRMMESSVFEHLMEKADYMSFIRHYFKKMRGTSYRKVGRLLNLQKMMYVFYFWILGLVGSCFGFGYETLPIHTASRLHK